MESWSSSVTPARHCTDTTLLVLMECVLCYIVTYSNSVQFSGLEPAIEDGITDAGAHGQEVADPENEVVFLKIGHKVCFAARE